LPITSSAGCSSIADLGHLAVDLSGQCENLLTHFGQGKAWAAPGNQLPAQLFFQALEGLADRRLGQVQARRCTADAQLLANHPKGAQQVPVEAVIEQAAGIAVGHGRGSGSGCS